MTPRVRSRLGVPVRGEYTRHYDGRRLWFGPAPYIEPCQRCMGKGTRRLWRFAPNGTGFPVDTPCPSCLGRGLP